MHCLFFYKSSSDTPSSTKGDNVEEDLNALKQNQKLNFGLGQEPPDQLTQQRSTQYNCNRVFPQIKRLMINLVKELQQYRLYLFLG